MMETTPTPGPPHIRMGCRDGNFPLRIAWRDGLGGEIRPACEMSPRSSCRDCSKPDAGRPRRLIASLCQPDEGDLSLLLHIRATTVGLECAFESRKSSIRPAWPALIRSSPLPATSGTSSPPLRSDYLAIHWHWCWSSA